MKRWSSWEPERSTICWKRLALTSIRLDPAAATLRDLGFARATDLVRSFNGWAAAGLPSHSGAIADEHASRDR